MAEHKNLSDEELLRQLQASDHSAFNEIYRRYFELLFIHVHKKLLNEDQAKDIVQDIFTMLWFKRTSGLLIKDLPAYLFTTARNKVFDLYSHQQVQQRHLESLQAFLTEKPVVSTDHQIREAQFKAYIDLQIQNLPPKMRAVFEMSRKEELTYKEIAEQLSTTENNVSKQVNNALRILRTKLNSLIFTLF